MRTVDRAYIDPHGRYVVTITRNRIVRHTFVADSKGQLATTPTWEQKMTHVSAIVIGDRIVVATNTAGDHLAIDAESGEVVWEESAGPHRRREGYTGLMMPFAGTECFAFASWSGALTLYDAATGGRVAHWETRTRQPRLALRSSGELWAFTSQLPVSDTAPVTLQLVRYEPATETTEQRRDFGSTYHNMVPSPAGTMALAEELVVPPGTEDVARNERQHHWRTHLHLLDFDTLASQAMYDVPFVSINIFSTTWSPDLRYVGVTRRWTNPRRSTQVVLDTATMYVRAEFDHSDVRHPPVFHPDGDHLVLPRARNTPIVRLSEVDPPVG